MEEHDLFRDPKKQSELTSKYGIHVAGICNLGLSIPIYPLFMMSYLMQATKNTPSRGDFPSLKSRVQTMLFDQHSSNRPFRAPLLNTYRTAITNCTLQGIPAFYRGFGLGQSHFYISILARQYITENIEIETMLQKWAYEIGVCSLVEFVTYPLFTGQARFVLQPVSRTFCTYQDFPAFLSRAKLGAWAGCLSILPKQILLTSWVSATPQIDAYTDAAFQLGQGSSSKGPMLMKEIVLGLFGYTMIYPITTAARRVAVQSTDINMQPKEFGGVAKTMLGIWKQEGYKGLFRGYFSYSIAMSFWLLGIPVATQMLWAKTEDYLIED